MKEIRRQESAYVTALNSHKKELFKYIEEDSLISPKVKKALRRRIDSALAENKTNTRVLTGIGLLNVISIKTSKQLETYIPEKKEELRSEMIINAKLKKETIIGIMK